jgi:membrane fusion protein (multidrug efflux system)
MSVSMKRIFLTLGVLGWSIASAQQYPVVSTELAEVVAKPLEATTVLPGELKPYLGVDIYAKVSGFMETVNVDRASFVKKGEVLGTIRAPEMEANVAEARARVVAVQAQREEAKAKLAATDSTLQRLHEAAKTPGAVAGNDLVVAEKNVEAGRALVESLDKSIAAAEAAVRSIDEMTKYLTVTADFDGVITERFADPGSLVGPQSRNGAPLLRLEQISRLRLVVPVPEAYSGKIMKGAKVSFTVSAYPGETFYGVVARPAYSVDQKTRTMPVELDVNNASGRLAPGMYADVSWPVRRPTRSLFVPRTAIKSTTERIFVIRVSDGKADWVDVRRGATNGELVEVFGDLKPGDKIVLRATDEIRPGTRITPRS